MYTQKNATSPNLIGGYNGNAVTALVTGATISGGGQSGFPNRVTDEFGTVSGGLENIAGDSAGTTGDATYATVGGGIFNTASGGASTVGGGILNTASGETSSVGGGSTNTASGSYSTVAGGDQNTASGETSTVGGGEDNTASVQWSTVGGGQGNTASGLISTVGGGFENIAGGSFSTVPGGAGNKADGDFSFAAGYRAEVRPEDSRTFVWSGSLAGVFESTGIEQFLIKAEGGVGINTNAPGAALHIVGNNVRLDDYGTAPVFLGRRAGGTVSAPSAPLATNILGQFGGAGFDGTDFTTVRGYFESAAAENWSATAQGTYLRFETTPIGGTTPAERMRILDDGNVGIGTATPSYKLEVAGPMAAQSLVLDSILVVDSGTLYVDAPNDRVGIGDGSPDVALDVVGDINYTGVIQDVSDERLKENIAPVRDALSKVRRLEGVYFNMKDTPEERDVGFIAQNVQEVLPEAVSVVDPEGGYLGVSYPSVIPLLVEAIKEMDTEQATRIASQEQEIKELRQRVEALERALSANAQPAHPVSLASIGVFAVPALALLGFVGLIVRGRSQNGGGR